MALDRIEKVILLSLDLSRIGCNVQPIFDII